MSIIIRVGWYSYADPTGENPWTIAQEWDIGERAGDTYRARTRRDAIAKANELVAYWERAGEHVSAVALPHTESVRFGS